VENGMRSIGEMARASGLSVSSLRFYDGAGVFVPARVDPQTGYRWYAPDQLADARLLARLRRVGMPLADVSRVLGGDRADAVRAVNGHLRRLEDGLADARRELSTVLNLLDLREKPMSPTRLSMPAAQLAAALDAVRFAANPSAEHPAVAGVLFDAEGALLRLVATDRYRLAVAQVALDPAAAAVSAIVPTSFVDALRALLPGAGTVELVVDELRLSARTGGTELTGERIDQDYPDYRRLVRLETTHQTVISAQVLRERLESAGTRTATRGQDGAEFEVSELVVGEDGTLGVGAGADGGLRVQVNRAFLLEAVNAGAAEQLVLEFGGPIAPLAIRFPERAGTFSLLMPTRP
jgi:DNA-binding transcriptional MerR regulator